MRQRKRSIPIGNRFLKKDSENRLPSLADTRERFGLLFFTLLIMKSTTLGNVGLDENEENSITYFKHGNPRAEKKAADEIAKDIGK